MLLTSSLKPKAQDTNYLRSVWETINFISCPYSYNFHMHTNASDGRLTPLGLVEQAIGIGLQGFAITDHHSVDGYRQAEQYLVQLSTNQGLKDLPHLWTGFEITSQLLEVEVHILGYGFDPEHPSLELYLQGDKPQGEDAEAKRVIDSIHQAEGLAVLAHPERYRRSALELIPAAADLGIDGVETYYAYTKDQIWTPSPAQTQRVQELAAQYNLYSTCGTDSHGLSLLQRI
ncbi:PHP domain-containing protein [Pleurocapsa sp. PCC 7319]|uniref:PHP domain-containing protein n=1 Tax=Pleurocapsa sp. PCC 7319 TaxID=118161 RepID=UPI0004769E89|nr:PHP domain-containing protein [Pleurocapsa sp. PCC 7319]